MKRLFALIVLGWLLVMPAWSNPVDMATVKRVAHNFLMSRNVPVTKSMPSVAYTATAEVASAKSTDLFYVLNCGDAFVVVAADDRIVPVLGYSTEGAFDPQNVPIQMQDYLEAFSQEITAIINEPSCPSLYQERWATLLSDSYAATKGTAVVGPLLSTIWAQTEFYNSLCPEDAAGPAGHVPVGCVATAMAQVIRYWEYPVHGVGSHTYLANSSAYGYGDYGEQTADYEHTTYDYANMPNRLTASSTQAQVTAVATLSYHCGVSVDMFYGPKGSGSFMDRVSPALIKYFDYPDRLKHLSRNNYTDEEWVKMLKAELDLGHPMPYDGSGDAGGHAFVCDGYDNEDYFHFNWGWNGAYNNYFLVSSLNPSPSQPQLTFNNRCSAIFGIDAVTPVMLLNTDELILVAEKNKPSDSKKVTLRTYFLTNNINLTTIGNFQISSDGVNYASSLIFNKVGGELYVRFNAGSADENGRLLLSSGSTKDTVELKGLVYDITCDAPENLDYEINEGESVELYWDAPAAISKPVTVTWNTNTNLHLSYQSAYKSYQMHRYTEEDLLSYHGMQLKSVSFKPSSAATYYKIVVYQGGSYVRGKYDPGAIVAEQVLDLSSLDYSNWNTIALDQPVTIDAAQELWYGIYLEAPANTAAMNMGRCSEHGKGNILGTVSGNTITWAQESHGYCNALKAEIAAADNGVVNYDIARDGNHLATVTTLQYIDPLKVNGTYHYTITANWANGCSAVAEQDVVVESTPDNPCAINIPYTADFDSNIEGTAGNTESNVKCWTKLQSGSEKARVGTNLHNSTNAYEFGSPGTNGYTMAVLPPVAGKTKVKDLSVGFYGLATGPSVKLEIGVMTNPADISTFQVVATLKGEDLMLLGWKYFKIPLSSYTGRGKYVAFRNVATGSLVGARIDDLKLDNCTMPMPYDVKLSANGSKVTVDWTDISEATQWEVEYGLHGTTAEGMAAGRGTKVKVDHHPVMLDLAEGKTYDFYVYSCGADGAKSEPSAQRYIHTDNCDAGQQCHYTLNWTVSSTNLGSLNNGVRLYDANGIWIKEYYVPAGKTSATFDINICNGDEAIFGFNRGTTYQTYTNFTITDESGTEVAKVTSGNVQASSYSGATVKTGAIINNQTAASPWLKLKASCSTCAAPTNFTASQITDRSAHIVWQAPSGETGQKYTVEYMAQNEDDWHSVSVQSATSCDLSNLTEGTTYFVRIKAVCGNGRITYTDILTFDTKVKLHITSVGNGSVSPVGDVLVDANTVTTFTMTPQKGHYWISLKANDVEQKEVLSLPDSVVQFDYQPAASANIVVRFAEMLSAPLDLCSDELPYMYGNERIEVGTESGDYIIHMTTDDGLDSLFCLKLTVRHAPTPEICMVSVGNDNFNHISWAATEPVIHYNIYRENFRTGEYEYAGRVAYGEGTTWTDSLSEPMMRPNRYRLTLLDSCFNESAHAADHQSIHLTKLRDMEENTVKLSWTAYEGKKVKAYYILRGTDKNSLQPIDTVEPSVQQYNDTFADGVKMYYRIAAELTDDCGAEIIPVVFSNTLEHGSSGVANMILQRNIAVAPNPTTSTVKVTVDNLANGRIEIYDVYGRLLTSQSAAGSQTVVDMQAFAAGVYILRVIEKQLPVGTVRVVKQ